MAPRRASAPLARASSVEMGASWWVEGQRLGGVGSVAAAVDHVFVRAKEKSKTVSGGEGRGRLGPKEERGAQRYRSVRLSEHWARPGRRKPPSGPQAA